MTCSVVGDRYDSIWTFLRCCLSSLCVEYELKSEVVKVNINAYYVKKEIYGECTRAIDQIDQTHKSIYK